MKKASALNSLSNAVRTLAMLRKMGLEPTRYCYHKILSLARLPVPTLPRFMERCVCHAAISIISFNIDCVNRKNEFF